MTNINKDELFTVEEASDALGVKEITIRQWIYLKKIKVVKLGGWAIRIPAEEIQRKEKDKKSVEVQEVETTENKGD